MRINICARFGSNHNFAPSALQDLTRSALGALPQAFTFRAFSAGKKQLNNLIYALNTLRPAAVRPLLKLNCAKPSREVETR
jgi:hypothetical protein